MNLRLTFLRLNLWLILVSVAVHEIAARQFVYLAIALSVCGAVWRYEKQGRPLRVSEFTATLLCLVAFGISMFRGSAGYALRGVGALDVQVPTVGQFLVIFQCVYLLRKRRPRDYIWIYLVTVVHMGAAGMLMPEMVYGAFFFVYALVGVCTLTCYNTWLEARAAKMDLERPAFAARRLLLAAVPATVALMLPVAVVFALLPRSAVPRPLGYTVVRSLGIQRITGFSEQVQLGQLGAIQDNPQHVMRVKVFDPETDARLRPDELLLRGISLDGYEQIGGVWTWEVTPRVSTREAWRTMAQGGGEVPAEWYGEAFPGYNAGRYRRIRCEISLRALQSRRLFTPFAIERLDVSQNRALLFNVYTHDLYRYGRRHRALDYSLVARLHETTRPAGGAPQRSSLPADLRRIYTALPVGLAARVRQLAREIAPAQDCPTDYDTAQRILAYLSDSSRFSYTVVDTPTAGVEPVEDFLFNRRQGHCEYFAASMAVLLRAAGVPARLVNGFRASEYNPIDGAYVVRQSDAHSWVEAYLEPDGWRTFDPSVMREAAAEQPVFVRRWWRNLYDAADALWARYVLSYDHEDQAKVVGLAGKTLDAFGQLWIRAVALAGGGSLDFTRRELRRIARFLLAPVLATLLVAAVALGLFGLFDFVRWLRLGRGHGSGPAAARGFYRRMEHILRSHGFLRPAWVTPLEFQHALAASKWPALEPVSVITRVFCEVRYGGKALTPAASRMVAQALRVLKKRAAQGQKSR